MAASPASPSDRELVFTRLLKAPVEVVFAAFTDAAHLPHWWGPYGFTTTIQEMDVRPGGEWRLVMRSPEGQDYHNHIVFVEVVKPTRLVFRHVPEPGSEPVTHKTTVTLESQGGATFLTMRMVFPTVAEKEFVTRTYQADERGKQTLERLAQFLTNGPGQP